MVQRTVKSSLVLHVMGNLGKGKYIRHVDMGGGGGR